MASLNNYNYNTERRKAQEGRLPNTQGLTYQQSQEVTRIYQDKIHQDKLRSQRKEAWESIFNNNRSLYSNDYSDSLPMLIIFFLLYLVNSCNKSCNYSCNNIQKESTSYTVASSYNAKESEYWDKHEKNIRVTSNHIFFWNKDKKVSTRFYLRMGILADSVEMCFNKAFNHYPLQKYQNGFHYTYINKIPPHWIEDNEKSRITGGWFMSRELEYMLRGFNNNLYWRMDSCEYKYYQEQYINGKKTINLTKYECPYLEEKCKCDTASNSL